jgi:hypothetical protein
MKVFNCAQEFLDVYQVLRTQLLDDELIVGQPGFSRDYFGEVHAPANFLDKNVLQFPVVPPREYICRALHYPGCTGRMLEGHVSHL